MVAYIAGLRRLTVILLIGARGSMGRRYAAILRYLNVPYVGHDVESTAERVVEDVASAEIFGTIIATPTATHYGYWRLLDPLGKPILCEKPLTKSPAEMEEMLNGRSPLRMMTQYALLDDPCSFGETLYDYYDSGKDGLAWDCMQIIGLARGPLVVRNESPVWRCILNWRVLTLEQVHQAYVDYVRLWLEKPDQDDRQVVRRMHERAAAWGLTR